MQDGVMQTLKISELYPLMYRIKIVSPTSRSVGRIRQCNMFLSARPTYHIDEELKNLPLE